MRITYLINGMYNSAGRERVVANKAQFLTERGHTITIITTDQDDKPYYYDVPDSVNKVDLRINNNEYAQLPITKRIIKFLKNNRLFKCKLKSFLDSNPQDVIVTLEDRFIPALVNVSEGKSVLLAESHFNKFALKEIGKSVKRGFIQQLVYSIRTNYVRWRYYHKLDAYVLLTSEDLEYCKNEIRNVTVIPNSISYNQQIKAPLNNKEVIAVGRLSYQKGFERLVEAWRQVVLNCPDWTLNIYGDGEDKEMLTGMIDKYQLANSIHIYPPTHQIEEKLLSSSIYVLSSRFEGLPMVLLEAMSIGLPIVSYDCKTGPKDIIKEGYNGYLVPEGNIELLAKRIIELIQSENLRKTIGENAKVEAQFYSHEVIAKKWEALFEKLIRSKK